MPHAARLKVVRTPVEWAAFHRIRRAELFSSGRYDENHPDDRAPENTPYLLEMDGTALGVARLDRRGAAAIVRLVAVPSRVQGKGYGRILSDLLEVEARAKGITQLYVNAGSDVVGFYERLGWKSASWDPSELTGIAANAVQMAKELG